MSSRAQRQMLEAGLGAPDFQLPRLGGESMRLSAALEQGPVVLAFFKVSCPVCQLELPYLERLAHGAVGWQVIGVSQDDAALTAKFNQRFGVTFPVLLDESARGYAASNAYGLTHVPSVFVIEPDGAIAQAWSGFARQELEALRRRMQVAALFRAGEQVPAWKAG